LQKEIITKNSGIMGPIERAFVLSLQILFRDIDAGQNEQL